MRTLLLLKHVEKKIVIPMYFKSESKTIDQWSNYSSLDEWEVIHKRENRKAGHRYELTYSKFDEQGELYSRYIICFSKKEAVLLAGKIKEVNSNYITNIKKLY